jgi:hypothetical protein
MNGKQRQFVLILTGMLLAICLISYFAVSVEAEVSKDHQTVPILLDDGKTVSVSPASVFETLKENKPTGEATFTATNPLGKDLDKNTLQFTFNEVCGKILSYEVLTLQECPKTRSVCIPIEKEVCSNVCLDENFNNKTSCLNMIEFCEFININSCQDEIYYETDWCVLNKYSKETKDYKIQAEIQDEKCSDGSYGHKIDWIPLFKSGELTLERSEWSWWNATSNCSGGSISIDGSYYIHTFTTNDTFNASECGVTNVEVLVVGGGGSGGTNQGGGGGAGGLIYNTSYSINATSYSVVVGAGGASFKNSGAKVGNNGSLSSFAGLTALGGGGGGATDKVTNSGGSGGGGAGNHDGTTIIGGSGTAGQGTNGGSGTANSVGGGGGGGSSTNGTNGISTSQFVATGGAGGNGTQINITGTPTYYAGGGGGAGGGTGSGGVGGLGGGGNGSTSSQNGTHAVNGTGGGGGATRDDTSYYVGSGGTGIVIIKYSLASVSLNINSPVNQAKYYNYTSVFVNISIVNIASMNFSNITVKLYNSSSGSVLQTYTNNTANNSYTFNFTGITFGSYSVNATIFDTQGNNLSSSAAFVNYYISLNLTTSTPTGRLYWNSTLNNTWTASVSDNAVALDKFNLTITDNSSNLLKVYNGSLANTTLSEVIDLALFNFTTSTFKVKLYVNDTSGNVISDTSESYEISPKFGICNSSAGLWNGLLNFSVYDEISSSIMTGDITSGVFSYKSYGSSLAAESLSYTGTGTNFSFCSNPSGVQIETNWTLIYSSLPYYPERRNIKTGLVLTTITPSYYNLSLLNTSYGIYARFKTIDTYGNAITGSTATAYYSGSVVEIENGDDAGLLTFFLNPALDYNMVFEKTGYVTSNLSIRPTSETYNIVMQKIGGSSIGLTYADDYGYAYSISPSSSSLNGSISYTFTFDLISSYWNVTGCSLWLNNLTSNKATNTTTFNTTVCSGRIVYTTPSTNDYVIFGANVTSSNGTVQFSKTYYVNNRVRGNHTLVDFFDRVSGFSGAGFDNFGRWIISLMIIIGIIFSMGKFGVLTTERAALFIWSMALFFSYFNFLPLNLASPESVSFLGLINLQVRAILNQWGVFIITTLIVIVIYIDRNIIGGE